MSFAHFFITRFTGFAFNMGKWNCLPKSSRAKSAARNVRQAASPSKTQPVAPQPIPPTALTQASQGISASITASENQPLELAIRRHLSQIPEAEKEVFRDASKSINEGKLLLRVREYDEAHKQNSSFRPQAERLSKFFGLINRLMGGIAIGIQAQPEISALVVGAVRIVIDLAINFVAFFSKLSDMLCQFQDYLEVLPEYAKASENDRLRQESIAKVYGDLLDFCRLSRKVFVDSNNNPRKWTSLRLFMRQQWEPFESDFGLIKANVKHHLDVLHHVGQARQLNNDREAQKERRLQEKSKLS